MGDDCSNQEVTTSRTNPRPINMNHLLSIFATTFNKRSIMTIANMFKYIMVDENTCCPERLLELSEKYLAIHHRRTAIVAKHQEKIRSSQECLKMGAQSWKELHIIYEDKLLEALPRRN